MVLVGKNRILEVYASRDAYDAHIKSPHFQKYKSSTLAMVKSLRLVDMEALNAEAMPLIFKKMSERPSVPNTVQP
ncbi:TPA: putative quinol monooxygenase [Pseudomonas aeruginosa]